MGFVGSHKITTAYAILFINLIIGTLAMHYLEGWSFIDSAYFCVVTLATIGYGDLYPKTVNGKLFVMAYIIWGVSTTLYALTLVADSYLDRYSKNYENLAKFAIGRPYKAIQKASKMPLRNVGRLHKFVTNPDKYRFEKKD